MYQIIEALWTVHELRVDIAVAALQMPDEAAEGPWRSDESPDSDESGQPDAWCSEEPEGDLPPPVDPPDHPPAGGRETEPAPAHEAAVLIGRGALGSLVSESRDNEGPDEEDRRGEWPPPERGGWGHPAISGGVQKMKAKIVGRIITPNRGWRQVMGAVWSMASKICESMQGKGGWRRARGVIAGPACAGSRLWRPTSGSLKMCLAPCRTQPHSRPTAELGPCGQASEPRPQPPPPRLQAPAQTLAPGASDALRA